MHAFMLFILFCYKFLTANDYVFYPFLISLLIGNVQCMHLDHNLEGLIVLLRNTMCLYIQICIVCAKTST